MRLKDAISITKGIFGAAGANDTELGGRDIQAFRAIFADPNSWQARMFGRSSGSITASTRSRSGAQSLCGAGPDFREDKALLRIGVINPTLSPKRLGATAEPCPIKAFQCLQQRFDPLLCIVMTQP